MIVDTTEQKNNPSGFEDYPLSLYLGKKYTFTGNVLTEIGAGYTIFYMDIPYINRDAGIALKLWFFDKLVVLLHDISKQNYYIEGDTIKQRVLVKETAESKIVNTDVKKICSLNKSSYTVLNNGTYRFSIVFPFETLPKDMCELIEAEYLRFIHKFRTRNNE